MASLLACILSAAVGSIDWLDDVAALPLRVNSFKSNAEIMRFIADDRKRG